jgi:hypothetical protein
MVSCTFEYFDLTGYRSGKLPVGCTWDWGPLAGRYGSVPKARNEHLEHFLPLAFRRGATKTALRADGAPRATRGISGGRAPDRPASRHLRPGSFCWTEVIRDGNRQVSSAELITMAETLRPAKVRYSSSVTRTPASIHLTYSLRLTYMYAIENRSGRSL